MKHAIRACCLSVGALALFLLSVPAMATDKVLDARLEGQEAVSLAEYFSVLEDPSQALTLADVLKADVAGRFVTGQPPAEALNFGFTRSAYWLRLTLRNPAAQPVRQMLEIRYPLLSSIELHQPAANGGYRSLVTGAATPFATRPYANRYFVFPLELAPRSEQVIFLRFQSISAVLIPAKLWETETYHMYERDDYIFQSLYFGLAIALILFNLLVFVALRDVVYLQYVAFNIFVVLTIMVGNGWAKEFLWPGATWWANSAVNILGALALATLLVFTRRMLGTRDVTPRLDGLFKVFIGIALFLQIGFLASIRIFNVAFMVLVLAAMALVLFTGAYCAFVKRQRIAVLFLAAFSGWIGFIVTVQLLVFAQVPANIFILNGWKIGSALEMLLLAFTLAYRFNLIRRQATEDVELVNASLAQRLREREAELTRSHRLLREIELRQTLYQERQRLMQDMHDGLGSSLTSALRMAERGRMDKDKIAFVIRGCIDDLKLAIDSYEVVDADLLLLLATLRFRLEPRLEGTGITMRWEVQSVPPMDWLNPRNALHILRILQEAITNVMRHAEATEIRVGTRVQGDRVLVTIADNGKGFQVAQGLDGNGKGLSNQMRRAQAIGADITWESNAAGTTLTLSLPIASPAESEAADQAGRRPTVR